MKIFGIGWMVACLVGGMINGVVKNDDIYKRNEETEAKYAMVEQVEIEEIEEEEEEEYVEEEVEEEEEEDPYSYMTDEYIKNSFNECPHFTEQFNELKRLHDELEGIWGYSMSKQKHMGFCGRKEDFVRFREEEVKEELSNMEIDSWILKGYRDAIKTSIVLEDATMVRNKIENAIY